MNDDEQNPLRIRTKAFALEAIRLFVRLPKTEESKILGRQMVRAATSVGAHYREACRARSRAEFISKLEVGNQELDETSYWLELIRDAPVSQDSAIKSLLAEASELMAMQTSSIKTTKRARGDQE